MMASAKNSVVAGRVFMDFGHRNGCVTISDEDWSQALGMSLMQMTLDDMSKERSNAVKRQPEAPGAARVPGAATGGMAGR